MSVRITSGRYKGRRLKTTEGKGLRPTTERARAAIFSILGAEIVEGARVIDLFAGTGALGIEALSRGAAWADFVEADRRRASMIRESISDVAPENEGKVYHGRVEQVLKRLSGNYRIVLIGAPYDLTTWDALLEEIDEVGLIENDGVLVAEYRYGTALKERYGRLVKDLSKKYGDTGLSIYRLGESLD